MYFCFNASGAFGSNDVIASLKNQLSGDRMTLGLKQTRGGASPLMRNMRKSFNKKDEGTALFFSLSAGPFWYLTMVN